MKIELKNIKYAEYLSEETNAFTADVYVNGKRLLYAKNDGRGGSTFYHLHSGADAILLEEAEAYCKALPSEKSEFGDLKMDLEFKIDLLVDEWIKAKADAKNAKKIAKACLNGLVYKTNNGYSTVSWKGYTIETLLKRLDGAMVIQQAIKNLWKEGKQVINTNIPQEWVK